MAFASSPVQYPATSSPRRDSSPRKRRRLEAPRERSPLKDVHGNAQRLGTSSAVGGFIDEDDSEEESPLESLYQEKATPILRAGTATVDDIDEAHFGKNDSQLERHDSGCEITSSPPLPIEQDANVSTGSTATTSILFTAHTSGGRRIPIRQRRSADAVHYSALAAARSIPEPGRAQKSYYGIDIHALVDEGKAILESQVDQVVTPNETVLSTTEQDQASASSATRTHLWTEKYRPRKFTDLIGDERTHRSVLRWLKAWEPIVFPSQHPKPKARSTLKRGNETQEDAPERTHRKILLLTGPAGLGKTTLAHVCAKQAGYETHEINASDERTGSVVKGRIRDMLGTENVKGVDSSKKKKTARPVCVVVDEVDGVVSGSSASGGEGGFIKALLDLLALDHKNAIRGADVAVRGKRRGDTFRMLRPLILICNDVYHPSLRLLRHGPHAEVIHVRKPALAMVVPRLCAIFERESVPADSDGVRTLCEATWGVTSKRQGGKGSGGGGHGEGDIRSILVAGEWVAHRIRAAALAGLPGTTRLTRRWIEMNVVSEMVHGGGMAKTLGRGGARDVVERVFKHNAGFAATLAPSTKKRKSDNSYGKEASIGASEAVKRGTMEKLREMIESSGEDEKILLDCFATYPGTSYQDTTTLTKPTHAYAWLHFSDLCSRRVHHQQEWDLMPYLSYPVLAFHNLFASSSTHQPTTDSTASTSTPESQPHPLTTIRADGHAHEATRANTATLSHFQTQLSLPLQRSFRSHASLATELIPYTLRILNPSVKPTLVSGAASVRKAEDRDHVDRSISALLATGVKFEKGRVDLRDPDSEMNSGKDALNGGVPGRDNGGWIYRMEPPLDELGSYAMLDSKSVLGGWEGDAGKSRYALRQVLAQGHEAAVKTAEAQSRARRSGGTLPGADGHDLGDDAPSNENKALEEAKKKSKAAVKRDFFGRVITATTASGDAVAADGGVGKGKVGVEKGGKPRVWVSCNEGSSNAVRKPITMKELMEGL